MHGGLQPYLGFMLIGVWSLLAFPIRRIAKEKGRLALGWFVFGLVLPGPTLIAILLAEPMHSIRTLTDTPHKADADRSSASTKMPPPALIIQLLVFFAMLMTAGGIVKLMLAPAPSVFSERPFLQISGVQQILLILNFLVVFSIGVFCLFSLNIRRPRGFWVGLGCGSTALAFLVYSRLDIYRVALEGTSAWQPSGGTVATLENSRQIYAALAATFHIHLAILGVLVWFFTSPAVRQYYCLRTSAKAGLWDKPCDS